LPFFRNTKKEPQTPLQGSAPHPGTTTPRERGTTPRSTRTNPRAIGQNPRGNGTNPRARGIAAAIAVGTGIEIPPITDPVEREGSIFRAALSRAIAADWHRKRAAGELPPGLGVTEYRQQILAAKPSLKEFS
jgi:hypothetical protein